MKRVIKEVMNGSVDERSLNLLKDTPLNEIDWLHNKDLLFKWNALQSTPNKVRQFTFVQKSGIVSLIEKVKQMPKWAYIKHDKDITEDGIHYHFYIEFPNPRSFVAVANDLEIPVTSLQKVLNKRGILEYLTHENQPEKHHYNQDEIVTNMDLETEVTPRTVNVLEEFEDFLAVKEGRMDYRDFVTKYNAYFATQNFTSRMKGYNLITQVHATEERANLSPFRVPSSSSRDSPC